MPAVRLRREPPDRPGQWLYAEDQGDGATGRPALFDVIHTLDCLRVRISRQDGLTVSVDVRCMERGLWWGPIWGISPDLPDAYLSEDLPARVSNEIQAMKVEA